MPFRCCLTGDLGEEQEKLLLKRQRLHPVTALKVAHHGSRFSSCEEFLNYIHPKAALFPAVLITVIIILPKRHWNAWKRKVVIFIVQKTADRFRFCTGKVSGRLDNRKTAVLTGVNYDSIMAEALKRGKIL